jgi:hypothetical protein
VSYHTVFDIWFGVSIFLYISSASPQKGVTFSFNLFTGTIPYILHRVIYYDVFGQLGHGWRLEYRGEGFLRSSLCVFSLTVP